MYNFPGKTTYNSYKNWFNISPNTFGLLVARSGWALKRIQVLGGVIDPDYQGEIKFILYNSDLEPFKVTKYDRISQLLLLPLPHHPIAESTGPTMVTARGAQGFGSINSRWKPGIKVWVCKLPHSGPRAAEVEAEGTSVTVALMYLMMPSYIMFPKLFFLSMNRNSYSFGRRSEL